MWKNYRKLPEITYTLFHSFHIVLHTVAWIRVANLDLAGLDYNFFLEMERG